MIYCKKYSEIYFKLIYRVWLHKIFRDSLARDLVCSLLQGLWNLSVVLSASIVFSFILNNWNVLAVLHSFDNEL